jgi:hypothetical protein
MKVKIKETGKIEDLEIIDPKTGLDWAADMTGDDPNIDYDGDDWVCDQDTFDWWHDVMTRYQKADDRFHEIRESLDDDQDLYKHLDSFLGVDVENYPEALNQGLDAWEKHNR